MNKANKDKLIRFAGNAFELTKMVLVITANTAIKLVVVGKDEIVKQYADYQKKNPKVQQIIAGATATVKSKVAEVSKDAKTEAPKPPEIPKPPPTIPPPTVPKK